MLQQIIINTLITASIYSLVAVGFAIIYKVVGFFHFAHAVVFTSGAYFTFLFKVGLGFSIYLAVPIAVCLSAVLGCYMEIAVYRPLRRKKASSNVVLLASLGIYIVLQNVISMVFGDQTNTIRSEVVHEGLNIFGARITPVQILTICASLIMVIMVIIFMKWSKLGKAMQAVANDPELSEISGIDSDRVIVWVFLVGSSLAGIAGILVALDVDMNPTMGMNALMMGILAMIVGGLGNTTGVAFGALLLGFAQHLGVWKISSKWQDAIAFIILFLFLLFKPQGFVGKKVKKEKL